MTEIVYYSCDLTSSKKKALLVVCYTEKKNEQSYESLLTISHKDFCDYNAKRYKGKKGNLEEKALAKALKTIAKQLPNVDLASPLTKIKQKSFYKHLHKNHCPAFWKLWTSIQSKSLKKEMEENCSNP